MANDNVDLQARERAARGKNENRRLRKTGMAPAILYNDDPNEVSTALAVPVKTVDLTLQNLGDNALYDVQVGSRTAVARVVDLQRDPVSGQLVHVDFTPVNMRERIEVTVPVTVVGEAPGVNEDDGVLQQVAYELQVESLPGNIPQEIEVDVSGLYMNENLSLGDIAMPEGVTLISDPEEVAATVTAPTEITEEEMESAGIVEEDSEEMGEETEGGEQAAAGEEADEEEAE
ncbi:50S ribosomal protein L25 [Rubrobacter aplysinae]|uniref:50S ribosomal protein L25 n=1 Tax=Rubrobacter aplysinae TaxID=909625 RepID=UPI00069E80DD|nr:50S ribosomal protein L25 [Rubrobacter aplysinae]